MQVLSQEKVHGLIGRIYDAAADERLWPVFFRDFSNAVDGEGTGLVYHDMSALRGNFITSVRNDPECEQQYLRYYGAFDALREVWLERFQAACPEGVVASEELIDWRQWRRTEYVNDFIQHYDIVHQVCCPIVVNAEWSCIFTCMRSRNKGSFSAETVGLMRLLWPHLQRAIQFHRRFSELEGRHRASLDALDGLPTGVILIDSEGRVLEMNRAAGQILSRSDGLLANKEGLAASTAHETRELRSKIAAAALTTRGTGVSAGGCLRIARPSGKRAFAVIVTPVSVHAFPPDARRPAVIVFVSDPETRAQTAPEIFEQLYKLTGAESRLAEQLMQGETLVHASERLGISHNTARTHLQRIYQKTDTSHQGDLVRMLLSSLPTIG
jgi:DNA-binding CsgD family transcriptional regulator/GAF domain-containing protein